MARTKWLSRLALSIIALLLYLQPCHAQFQHIGVHGQLLLAPTQGSQVINSLSWLMQIRAHHGIGFEVGIPFYLSRDPSKAYANPFDPRYEVTWDWRRRMLPLPTLRYRYIFGNAPFIGISVGAGFISETLVADRAFHAGNAFQGEVPAVNWDLKVRSPFLRVTAEAGIMPNLGKHSYLLLQAGIGLQVTNPPIFKYGDLVLGEGEVYRIRPYHGKDIFGNFQFGIGVKL